MTDKPKLLVTRLFPEAVLERAGRDYDCSFNETDTPWQGDELVARAAGHDAMLCSSSNKFSAEVIAALPDSIRILATFSVGYEHFDIDAAKARGIVLTNTPDVLTDATADITMMLLLCAARRAAEGYRMLREDRWTGWTPTQLLGFGFDGKRLAILGMGRIGQAVAARARPFGLEIHYHNRRRLLADEERGAVYHDSPEALLAVADFLSFNCPMSAAMKGYLDSRRIALLPDGAIIVNTARGGLIDDASLIAALKSGRIAAAGLDVFDGEPNVNPGYRDLDNIFMTPHQGSATVETRNAMGFRALDNLDAFFAGREPGDLLTP